jgi:hypothetical protein
VALDAFLRLAPLLVAAVGTGVVDGHVTGLVVDREKAIDFLEGEREKVVRG